MSAEIARLTRLGRDGAAGDEMAADYFGGADGRLYCSGWSGMSEVDPIKTLQWQRAASDASAKHIALIEKAAAEGQYGPNVTAHMLIPSDYERQEATRQLMGSIKRFIEGGN